MTAALLALLIAFAPAPFPKRPPAPPPVAGEYHYDPSGAGTSYRIFLYRDGKYSCTRYPDYAQYEGTWSLSEDRGTVDVRERLAGRPDDAQTSWWIPLGHAGLIKLGK